MVPDAFAAVYLGSFLLGLLFILVSALMGFGHQISHLPGVHDGALGDFGDSGYDPGHSHAGHSVDVAQAPADGQHLGVGHLGDDATGARQVAPTISASPFNLMTAMAFLTWFGAAGYVLHVIYRLFLLASLTAAIICGLVAGWLVFLLLVKVFLPGTITPEQHIVGNFAKVVIPIPQNGLGEVVYTMGGARHSDGARSVDGRPIPRGSEVVIVRYAKGIAVVEPWRVLLDEQGLGSREKGF